LTAYVSNPGISLLLAQAQNEAKEGGSFGQILSRLEDDPTDDLAAAFARLGRRIEAEEKSGSA
jgi:hypothetical protein